MCFLPSRPFASTRGGALRRGENVIPGGSAEIQGEHFALVYIIPGAALSFPTDRSVPALKGAQGTPARGSGTAFGMLLITLGSPLGSVGCVLGMPPSARMHLLCFSGTFHTTCCQCCDKDAFLADSSQTVIYSSIHRRGRPWCCVCRVSPPAHHPQRRPDKSRDMNKGQGSLPWATKAVLENKNSTERAHKRQKILPSCQRLSGPCLQRRGARGQAVPRAAEPQQRALHSPGPAYLRSPAVPCPECRPFVRDTMAENPTVTLNGLQCQHLWDSFFAGWWRRGNKFLIGWLGRAVTHGRAGARGTEAPI